MKKVTLLISILFASAVAAFAQSPHFIKGPTASFDSTTGDYCVSFKEAGLGNTPITYRLSVGTENFTFRCFTKSGNKPQGEPNSFSFSNVSTETTITPHNGQITASLCLVPDQDGASCQGKGLVLRLINAFYENLTFCDVTDNLCFDEPDLGGDVK
jgi:hypothetical protein